MKELSIEEKARRYDEAIEKTRIWKDKSGIPKDRQGILDDIFPELKDSEDEKIRKGLINLIKSWKRTSEEVGVQEDKIITWLEKQVEQKPTNKVEPKFKNGQWIIFNGLTLYVNEVVQCYYRTITIDGIPNSYDWNIDNAARLWTIQDAKAGDVLSYRDGQWIFIFEEEGMEPITFRYHSLLSKKGIEFNNYCETTLTECIEPATKEQRDLLFQKIKEAGYEWDAEKKELKKIEQMPTNNQFTPEQASVLDKHIDKFLEQNPAWTEEDTKELDSVFSSAKHVLTDDNKKWLKSLKGRVQPQPKQEWSEEDETVLGNLIWALENDMVLANDRDEYVNWLKSLRPQNRWKPSDEQMEALANALSLAKNCGEECAFDLRTLHEQLKKLKG